MHKKITLAYIAAFFAAQLGAQSPILWQPAMNVTSSSYFNLHPRIALNGNGDPLVVWGHFGINAAAFSRWNGSGFTVPVSLNPSSHNVYMASWTGPNIASKGDTVYVVYKKEPYMTSRSYIVRSFDGDRVFLPRFRSILLATASVGFPPLPLRRTEIQSLPTCCSIPYLPNRNGW